MSTKMRNPSVCSLRSQPPPLSGEILTSCQMLTFASSPNFFMLPERELASPQAMTEGCAPLSPNLNPSVCSLTLAATSPFRGDIIVR